MRVVASTLLLAALACGCGSETVNSSPGSTTSDTATASSDSVAPVATVPTSLDQVATTTPVPTGADPNPIRVTLADGCPSTVGGHPDFSSSAASWITNPDAARLAASFVPGAPSAALICRYAALDAVTPLANGVTLNAGDLYSSTQLEARAATALAETLNEIVPWNIGSGCLPTENKARYTAITFAIAGRTDVDVWLKDWYGCPEVSNGSRYSGLLINGQGDEFLAKLDSLAPRAPKRDHDAATSSPVSDPVFKTTPPAPNPSPDLGVVTDAPSLVAALTASGPLDNETEQAVDASSAPALSICASIVQTSEPSAGAVVHQALAKLNGMIGVVVVLQRDDGQREARLYGTGAADPTTGGCPLWITTPI
jgi:hypothetical protein